MIVATGRVKILIPYAQSLKDKRQVIKSILAQIKNKFNVSAAEVGDQDLWQRAVIGIAAVSNSAAQAQAQITSVINFIEKDARLEVADLTIEIL